MDGKSGKFSVINIKIISGMIAITDKFHEQKAHHHCPAAFSMNYWEAFSKIDGWNGLTHGVNTSVAEQLNSKLRLMTRSMRYGKLSKVILRWASYFEVHNLMVTGQLTPVHNGAN